MYEISRIQLEFKNIANRIDANVGGSDRNMFNTDSMTTQVTSIRWIEFLTFSIPLGKLSDSAFDKLMDNCMVRLDRANPLLSANKMREALNLHMKKNRIFRKL